MHGCIDLSVTPTAHKVLQNMHGCPDLSGPGLSIHTGIPEGHLFISVPIYGHASASVGFK